MLTFRSQIFFKPFPAEEPRGKPLSPIFYHKWFSALDDHSQNKGFETLNGVLLQRFGGDSGHPVEVVRVGNECIQVEIWRYRYKLRLRMRL